MYTHVKLCLYLQYNTRHYLHTYKEKIYMGNIIMQVHRALVIKREKG